MMNLLSIKAFFSKYFCTALLIAISGLFIYHMIIVGGYKLNLAEKDVIIAKREQRIHSLEEQAANLLVANEGFKASTQTQNNALDSLMKVISTNQKEAIAAINLASSNALRYKKSYDAILNAKAQSTADPCGSLNTRMNQYIELRQKESKK